MEKIQQVHSKLKDILIHKQSFLPQLELEKGEGSIDCSILEEEIEDAKYLIQVFEEYLEGDTEEIDFEMKAKSTMKTTTSGSIYDTLGILFPKEHIPAN